MPRHPFPLRPGLAGLLIRASLLCAALLANAPVRALDQAGEAAAAVTAFNAALSARNLDQALTHLATGGVQFSLRASHAGIGTPASPATDLRAHWSMVGPVLFASTTTYSRQVTITDARAVDDMATVWTRTVTGSLRSGQARPRRDSFEEIYLLVRKDGRWLIGAVADNRRPNDVGLAAPAAAQP